ncbi:hypothetical protein [Paraburkholderia saeva]|uniref:hypothetical protein n=1 Tax=Paraburkholderia saeva TaxID=2777537 RepID=UPI001D32A2FA|nr:hypothetical protein [Paraburkholderia saeva]CAG4887824.1 hypothetical protein R52603_00519 [Paraburkholderia saeva]
MAESTLSAFCSDEEWRLAKRAGLLMREQGSNAFDEAIHAFAVAARADLLEAANAAEAVLARGRWIEGSTDPEAVALFKLRTAIAKALGE